MTITLEAIKAEHSKISEIQIEAATITLAPGEYYAGIILGEDGAPSHHLILLPGDVDKKTWADAKEWATEQGGELPSRREQSLLFANLKSHFEARWYWSAEEYESNGA